MSVIIPTEPGTVIHHLADPEGANAFLRADGLWQSDSGYVYHFPETALVPFDVVSQA